MNPLAWTIFVSTLSISTIIVMFSHHWILAWLSLELNTLSILPLIMKPHHPRATEATTKYFLIQTTAAALVLFASTVNAWHTGNWNITSTTPALANILIVAALVLKMGVAPAHIWYPDIIQGSTLSMALVISTWQKLAPLTLLYLILNHTSPLTLLFTGTMSILIGGWGGLNQTQLRKTMAFSSIAHMGWLMIALTLNPHLAMLTMIIYIMLTSLLFLSLMNTSAHTLQDLGLAWSHSPMIVALATATLMSLGGLPPLTGFMPKLLILKELTQMKLTLLSTLLALMTLPSLYFYTRMAYLMMLTTAPTTLNTKYKWRFNLSHNMNPTPLLPLTTMLMPLMPLFYVYT
uniref:NADH-ubiquinone oxidoreductase chain 2 n=1 Tax=Pachydactylus kochii TaxID=1208027 RepID=A0A1S6M3K0_9SAUR|nr:NADH dehydrogenase subunit 2 [Pachydactylus kochii]